MKQRDLIMVVALALLSLLLLLLFTGNPWRFPVLFIEIAVTFAVGCYAGVGMSKKWLVLPIIMFVLTVLADPILWNFMGLSISTLQNIIDNGMIAMTLAIGLEIGMNAKE